MSASSAACAHCVFRPLLIEFRQSRRDCHGDGENGGQMCAHAPGGTTYRQMCRVPIGAHCADIIRTSTCSEIDDNQSEFVLYLARRHDVVLVFATLSVSSPVDSPSILFLY